jgi:hypothetical protein
VRAGYPKNHPYYGLSPADGIHILRNCWVQRSYVAEQASALAAELDVAMSATRATVPRRPARGKDFRIDPETHGMRMGIEKIHETSEERRMEQLLYLAYGPLGELGATPLWQKLVAFQVPLHDKRESGGWGHIDLLALNAEGRPVVIELKKQDAQETPLRALMEGVANAIVVQENWSAMARELRTMLARFDLDTAVAEEPAPVDVVVIAPESYWRGWQEHGELGQAVDHDARDAFRALRRKLEASGCRILLATFDWPFDHDPKVRTAHVDW